MPFKIRPTRPTLVHVIPNPQPDGCYNFACFLAGELKQYYHHRLLIETPLTDVPQEVINIAQLSGLDVIQVDNIDQETLNITGDVAMLYNVVDKPDLGRALPSVYYSYGILDVGVNADAYVTCSDYARTHRRHSGEDNCITLDKDMVVPPMINSRKYRNLRDRKGTFTVAILTSGAYDKYPCQDVMELMGNIPEGIPTYVTVLDKYKHPGVNLSIKNRSEVHGMVREVKVAPNASVATTIQSDVLVYASDKGHNEPYGRLVVEALALGKPVICRKQGALAETLEHGKNVLFYEDTSEVPHYLERLFKDSKMVNQLAANGQLWASWQDSSIHIGTMRQVINAVM